MFGMARKKWKNGKAVDKGNSSDYEDNWNGLRKIMAKDAFFLKKRYLKNLYSLLFHIVILGDS